MENIIEKHINRVERNFKKYFSLIQKSKYDKVIVEDLVQTYIDARYYNFEVNSKTKVFYRRIIEAIENRSKKLKKEYKDKAEIIDKTANLFQYFLYFDFVRNNISIQEVIQKIDEERYEEFNIRKVEDDDFFMEFTELVVNNLDEAQDVFRKYESKDFDLKLKRIDTSNNNFYRVKLNYNFSFPEVFSERAIQNVFDTDIIAEDKLFVEYPLVAIEVLKDVLCGNFSRIFVVDFSTDLFKKQKKLNQVLEILENQTAQDKIYFEITYEDFIKEKAAVFKLIRQGFKFALKTNDEMPELTSEDLKILEIISLILVDENDINRKKYKKNKILVI